MTLRELYEQDYPEVMWIGVYEGPRVKIVPDYADEYLETHGDYEVIGHAYDPIHDVLVVELNMEV